jgi:DNA helicase IV
MSLWWARREQLDSYQLGLIENAPLHESCLVLGTPGSGKTNVLLRRAQFVRGQEMPNVLVLTFTRPLTEFIKTGCVDAEGREIFPKTCVMTLEGWQRWLYRQHREELPEREEDLIEWKRKLASGAVSFLGRGHLPQYDALFIDEAQDLLAEEVSIIKAWSPVLFFVGDSRQKLYSRAEGLDAVRRIVSPLPEHVLPYHYRLAPEICRMADRIMLPQFGSPLSESEHYEGPKPGTIDLHGPLSRQVQIQQASAKLKEQIRVYAGLIKQGDRLGIIVARKEDRDEVFARLESDPLLRGKSKAVRSRGENEENYDPSLDSDIAVYIITVAGCKGLEFRAVHWLFSEELSYHYDNETYYTVVTRAKTSLDIYFTKELPQALARGYSPSGKAQW